MSLTFIDLFAGIGGFRLGMEQAGHKCLGYVEIDKFARKSYEAIHNTKGEWTAHDIATVTNDDLRLLRGQVDVICGGFPCQAFSIAGKRLGFEETRGTLFFEIARLAKEIQPQYLFLENVKGLLNHDGGNTFRTILSTLDELGYDAEWQVLNSKNFGVPQNRERVFIIGHSRRHSRRKVFPIRGSYEETSVRKVGMLNVKGKDQIRRVYGADGLSPCLTTMQGGGQEPKIIQYNIEIPVIVRKYEVDIENLKCLLKDSKENIKKSIKQIADELEMKKTTVEHWFRQDKCFSIPDADIWFELKKVLNIDTDNFDECITEFIEKPNEYEKAGRVYHADGIAPTLTRASADEKIIENKPPYRIRKLTPRECWRLQGFPDWAFDRVREVNSDSQLYKQAGNSVTVNVIHAIAERLV
ncbi:DNA (cytosine-5-)-methyltransferase [Bacillus cereus]|uniref:DNA (cytosine-5-)-methyltransferase n=1 Tax=Bacillus cereus TaxID=1396 RepID=UPI003D6498D0